MQENSASILGMIADDLTGACDTGVQFSVRGWNTVVLLQDQAPIPSLSATREGGFRSPDRYFNAGHTLIVVTTDSRAVPPQEARQKTERACADLQQQEIQVFYKKIDSTLKGNLGTEIEAILTRCGHPFALIAPAFPVMGRTLRDGFLHVTGEPTDPPIHLPSLLCEQTHAQVVCISLDLIRGEAGAIRDLLMQCSPHAHLIVLDAETEEDLALIVEAGLEITPPPLFVGSGGLAIHLADAVSAGRTSPPAPLSSILNSAVPIFIGSTNPRTWDQVEYLLRQGAAQVVSLNDQAAQNADDLIRGRKHPIFSLTWQEDHELASLQNVLTLLHGQKISGIICTGGDTAAHICRILEAQAIQLCGEVQTGIPWGRIIGGQADGMTICTKAGGFGQEDALLNMVRFLEEGVTH